MKAWIVTMEVNEYDQHGEYFIGWFSKKPTFQELKKLLSNESDVTVGKLTRGGGRQDFEDWWYYLVEVEQGINYDTSET